MLKMKSWKTTSAGILTIASALIGLYAAYDKNKSPHLDPTLLTGAVTAVLGGIGLLVARDNDKSSEDVGLPANSPQNKGSGGSTLPLVAFFLVLSATCTVLWGCAHINPGQDPFVVEIERTETIAKSTIDFVLNTDNSDREFWRSNAPEFHNFCEGLRQPQAAGTNVLPRASAIMWDLNEAKVSYKKGLLSSNQTYAVLMTVKSVLHSASEWQGIVTNKANLNQ